MIVFTSNNRPMDEKEFCQFFSSNDPLRGEKRELYEEGIRVPTIMHWPGVIAPGKSSEPMAAYDLLLTFNELAGGNSTNTTTGVSFANLPLGKPQQLHEYLYWEYQNRHKKMMLKSYRERKWKFIVLDPFDRAITYELYDLDQNPEEQYNLATTRKNVVNRLIGKVTIVRTDYAYDRGGGVN